MAIARVCKVVSAFGRSDLGERISDCRDQGVAGPAAAFRSKILILAKSCSIGLRSGLYGGR
jgi:hypothetical protein